MESVSRAVVKGLITHLRAQIPSITAIYDDFPNPNQKLVHPAGSIVTGQPTLTYNQRKSEFIGPVNPATNEAMVLQSFGEWRFSLQLDIWLDNKFDRHDILESVTNALEKGPAHGLSLKLPEYFDQWCKYTLMDANFINDEAGIQRSEWRVKFAIMAEIPAIQESVEKIIKQVENQIDVTDQEIPEPEKDPEADFLAVRL